MLYCNTYLLEKEQQLEEQELTYAEEIKTLLIAYPELKKKVDETLKETLAVKLPSWLTFSNKDKVAWSSSKLIKKVIWLLSVKAL